MEHECISQHRYESMVYMRILKREIYAAAMFSGVPFKDTSMAAKTTKS